MALKIFLKVSRCLIFVVFFYAFSFADIILFDAAHGQQAGNADWVIGYPPDWVGGFSDFGQVAREMDFKTKTCDTELTKEILKDVSILVLPEPNNEYKKEEIETIISFVKKGGGLLLIADHISSDRDHDGIDSPRIFNKFCPSAFGLRFNYDYISEHPIPVSGSHLLLRDVSYIGLWGACSLQPGEGSTPVIIYKTKNHPRSALLVVSLLGFGRVVAVGDSSIFEDPTGNRREDGRIKRLHEGLGKYDHEILLMNILDWLKKRNGKFRKIPAEFRPLKDFPFVKLPPPWEKKYKKRKKHKRD